MIVTLSSREQGTRLDISKCKEMRTVKIAVTIRIAIGIIFIMSGITKAFDTDYFANIMASYGTTFLYTFAPVIIFCELLIGIALLFGVLQRQAIWCGIVMLLLFTLVYSYGYFFAGIKDCGCFGKLKILGVSPIAVYFRNAILLFGLVFVLRKLSFKKEFIPESIVISSSFLMYVVAFISGFTFTSNNIWLNNNFKPVALSDHPLHNFVNTSMDSTYMVTVFSYTCPHCLNSIGNMEQYVSFGVVDKVIGIAVENPVEKENFQKTFRPSFNIVEYPANLIAELTESYPVSFFVKQDTIINIISGEVPSAYLLKKQNDKD